ncbi:MAG: signal peptide peptidase SppA [Crocinitomicaceae bacterium]|nr:signal peptide peptidase SppA [Crocinitomicaceae bacterium]|tara:strand:- start:6604 stop:8481 length:1878 start_codon:yes stop_codon:yes gene_type:complete
MEFLKNIVSSAIGSMVALLIGGIILIFIFVAALVGGLTSAFSDTSGNKFVINEDQANVLVFDLNTAIVERGGSQDISFGLNGINADTQLGLDQILEGLERASTDEDIEGILLNISGAGAYPSTLEDIRKGIDNFKESGKWVLAWAEVMTQKGYYMNCVADEVYLHPNGMMSLTGLSSQVMFYPGLFEKLGMDVTVLRGPNNKYKSAVEPYFRKDFSEANKEQINALLGDFWDTMTSAISKSRDIKVSLIDDAANDISLRLAEDAVQLGFIDKLLYEDELNDLMDEKLGEDIELSKISFLEYTLDERMFGFPLSSSDDFVELFNESSDNEDSDDENLGGEVAIIYAVGGIQSGEGDAATIGSETIAGAIREARLAPDVKAVVLRVNSPGGSALASDVIWRETKLLKESGKHFIVSMSDLAASGGYYISCAADKIYANATTITGSIGVFGAIPNLGGAFEKHLGISFDKIKTHDHAGSPDGLFAMNQYEIDAYNEIIVDIYDDFTSKVSEGRGLSKEQVEEVARGRVWTGEDALEIGLVDEIGSIEDAVAYAEGLLGGEDLERVYLPKKKDSFEAMIEDIIGIESGLSALNVLGIDDIYLKDVLEVKHMVESGEVIQARLPFNLYIK